MIIIAVAVSLASAFFFIGEEGIELFKDHLCYAKKAQIYYVDKLELASRRHPQPFL